MPKKLAWRRVLLFILFLLFVYFLTAWEKLFAATDVPIMKIEPANFTIEKNYIGTVQDLTAVSVVPFIDGFIKEIKVKGGQKVKKGDLLFILQQDGYAAQKKAAEANLEKAEADLDNALIYWERIERTKPKALAQTDIDNARTNMMAAEAARKAAKANLELATTNYNYTVIKSKINGVVGDINVSVGDLVSPTSSPLVYILQYSPIKVAFSVSNKEYMDMLADEVFSGWSLNLKLENGLPFNEAGKVKYINNKVDASTSSVAVFADFENVGRKLLPNAYVTVSFFKKIEQGIIVPKNNIFLETEGAFAYLLENGLITKVPVEIKTSVGNKYYITKGLKAGDKLILGMISAQDVGMPAKGN